jgi:hypothetical protein
MHKRIGANRYELQAVIGAMVELWTKEIISSRRIELENFFVLEMQIIDRTENFGILHTIQIQQSSIPRQVIQASKRLKAMLKLQCI